MLAKILFMAGFYVGVSLIGHTVTGMMESEPVEQGNSVRSGDHSICGTNLRN